MLRIDGVSENVCARTISAHKRLVMTGGTSGIGRRVLERLLAEYQNWTIILLARQSARSRELGGMRRCERLTVIDADLASLKSVDRACDDVIRSLGSHGIDALALNAGIQTVSTTQHPQTALSLLSR